MLTRPLDYGEHIGNRGSPVSDEAATAQNARLCRFWGVALGKDDDEFHRTCVDRQHHEQVRRPTLAERTYYPQG